MGLGLYFVTLLSTGKCIFVHHVLPVVQCKSSSLGKCGGVPCLSTEEEHLAHAGLAKGGLCLPVYSSCFLSWWIMSTVLIGEGDVWAGSLYTRTSAMRSCVCSACPLSPHHSDVALSSTKKNVEPELPWFIDTALKCLPFIFPLLPDLHSWKSHRRWVG